MINANKYIVVIGDVTPGSNLDQALLIYSKNNAGTIIDNYTVDYVLTNTERLCEIIDFTHPSVIVIKGNVHTKDYLKAILAIQKQINPEKRYLSHLCEFTRDDIRFFLTDSAFNINPNAEELLKQYDNVMTSIHGALIRKSAYILAENDKNMLDYAKGGLLILSRPNVKCMQLDTALDKERNLVKNDIAEDNVDLLIVPNINVGNAIWKSLTVFGNFTVSGYVLGTDFNCRLNSRGDSVESYLASLYN